MIVIIRNVFDVANSYEHRAADENQKWSRDYKKAVGDWNRCMRKTLNLSQSFDKITLVQYEDLYGGQNLDLLHSIWVIRQGGRVKVGSAPLWLDAPDKVWVHSFEAVKSRNAPSSP